MRKESQNLLVQRKYVRRFSLIELGLFEKDVALARSHVLNGWSCAIAENGVLVDREKGRGVLPVMMLVKRMEKARGRSYSRLVLADRVLGLAAFRAGALLDAKIMWGYMASDLAVQEGYRRGIPVIYHRLVPAIIKETGKELCPMEHLAFTSTTDRAFYDGFWAMVEKV